MSFGLLSVSIWLPILFGGLLLADNALWGGKVLDPPDAATSAVRRFDQWLLQDPHYVSTILPVGDGLAVGLRVS